jgi:hypothetical protein
MNERDVVYDFAERGNGFAEHLARFAVWLEFPHRFEPGAEAVLEGFDVFAKIAGLTVPFDEFGFVIEEVKVARRACHKKLDDALGFRRVMFCVLGKGVVIVQHRGKRETAELKKEFAAGLLMGLMGVM